MIGRYPIITFDTSAHNRLWKDGAQADAILAGLRAGIHFRFAGLSIDEMFATADSRDRAALRDSYCRLQHGISDCIYPHHEMIARLVSDHSKNPDAYDWRTVDVRAREYESGLQQRDFIADEQLSSDQRQAQMEAQKVYRDLFLRLRAKLSEILKAHGSQRLLRSGRLLAEQTVLSQIWY